MVQFYDAIPENVIPWIQQQKIFFVASAPLAQDGHINLSPKGFEGTFHIVNKNTVWYEDMSGSGVETISHIRENSRLTIMFCAFEGPPRIVRLWGPGTVHEFDSPEYNALIPLYKRQPGSRSVIMQDVQKVSTSCGYSIPFYTFKSYRVKLHKMAAFKEQKDIEAESCTKLDSNAESSLPAAGLKGYWEKNNQRSIDGLPGLLTAFKSKTTFDRNDEGKDWVTMQDDESIPVRDSKSLNGAGRLAILTSRNSALAFEPMTLVIGIALGVIMTLATAQLRKSAFQLLS